MDYPNELIARAFGAYRNAAIQYKIPYSEEYITVTEYALTRDGVSFTYKGEKSRGGHHGGFDGVKLMLLPPSEITDVDAIEVAKIVDPWMADFEITVSRTKYAIKITRASGKYVEILKVNAAIFVSENTCCMDHEVVDYLRSKNYDIGFANILSLIGLDIAVCQ